MARELYTNIAARAEADGTLKALSNVRVTVNLAGTASVATIYRDKTSGSQGPLSSSGATGTNPFVTGASGLIAFWSEVQELDVVLHDITVPARIADVTYGWSPLSAAVGGIPANRITADGGLPLGSLSAAIVRQDVPLGGVIDWWRPSTSFDAGSGAGNPPPGFEICDGRSIIQANHDFGAIGTIALPNLVDKFILGADITKANGVAGHDANGGGTSPGIGGTGGAHAVTLSGTQSGVPDHEHHMESADLGSGSARPALQTSGGKAHVLGHGTGSGSTSTLQPRLSSGAFFYGIGVGGVAGGAAAAAAGHNNIPAYVGLLKIMKVKRS